MSSSRYVFAAIAGGYAYCHFCIMEPILAQRLTQHNLTTMQIGLFFSIFPAFYISCSLLMPLFSPKIDKRVRMILSAVIYGVACLLIGPSQLLYFPDSLALMCVGQAIGGSMLAN